MTSRHEAARGFSRGVMWAALGFLAVTVFTKLPTAVGALVVLGALFLTLSVYDAT